MNNFSKVLKNDAYAILFSVIFAFLAYFASLITTSPLIISIAGLFLLVFISILLCGNFGFITLASAIFSLYYKLYKYVPTFTGKPESIEKKVLKYSADLANLKQYSIYFFIGLILISILAYVIYYYYIRKNKVDETSELTSSVVNTKTITFCAVFIALSVTLNSLRISSLSFGGFPILYSGLVLGPINGFIVGALSDILGFLIRPSSQGFNILFVLTSALTGAIPGFVMMFIKNKNKYQNFIWVLISFTITQFITSLFLVPIFMQILYGTPAIAQFLKMLPQQLIKLPVYTLLFISTQKVVATQIKFPRKLILK